MRVQRLGHVGPEHGYSPREGLACKGCWGVAMVTPQCFPFPNYLAAGCQLETPKHIPPATRQGDTGVLGRGVPQDTLAVWSAAS